MGKKGVMQLASKYDAISRYRCIEKLEELEKPKVYTLEESFEWNLKLVRENNTLKKKEVAYTALLDFSKHYSMSSVAKFFGYGRNKMMELLRELNHLTKSNKPSQYCINQDYMALKNVYIESLKCYKETPFITNGGIDFIARQLFKHKKIAVHPLPEDIIKFKEEAVEYLN